MFKTHHVTFMFENKNHCVTNITCMYWNASSQAPIYDSIGNGDGDNFKEWMLTTMIKLPFWKFNNVKLANLEKKPKKIELILNLQKHIYRGAKKASINYNEVKVVNVGKLRIWK